MSLKFTKPPLTYYGGKQQMFRHIMPLIPEHRIYNEPFFGGGAVFFAKEPSKVEFINDTNGEVVNFYKTLKANFSSLKKEVDNVLHSEYQHKQAIDVYKNPTGKPKSIRAWALWMLSHQSFYSIFCNTWKCSKQRNMATQIQTKKDALTREYAKRLERTQIFCRDALDVINKVDTDRTFHYIDPPYFNADMGHYGGYTESDFEALLMVLSTLKGKFLLSSYPSEKLDKYVKRFGWDSIKLDLPRAAGRGRKVEVLTFNYSPPVQEAKKAA